MENGVTVASAREELGRGYGTRGEPGYWLSHGCIAVPGTSTPERPAFRFRFEDLVADLHARQLTLF